METFKFTIDQIHMQAMACSACIHGRVHEGNPFCEASGSEIRFFDQAYACPKGLWRAADRVWMFGVSEPRVAFDQDSRTIWLNKVDARLMGILDARFERIKDQPLRWALGDRPVPDLTALNPPVPVRTAISPEQNAIVVEKQKKQSFWRAAAAALHAAADSVSEAAGMAAQFAVVVSSGRASDEDIAARRASCAACPSRRTNAKGEEYCGDCGCGENRWSVLDRKLEFAKLPCPQGKPGFYVAFGPEASDPASKLSVGGDAVHGSG